MGWWYDEEEARQELLREQARAKAEFCLKTGVAPSEYDRLTGIEIEAFVKEFNRQAERNKR